MTVASPGAPETYDDLGSYHRSIESPSPQAQVWCDRGLVWSYAFNHEEAIRCFDRALELDPDLAIARWGVAYAIGPNYNKAWEAFDPVDLGAALARARMELQLATTGRASAVERGLIEALQTRFPTDDPTTPTPCRPAPAPMPRRWRCWPAAYPDDIDVDARRGRTGQRDGVGVVGHPNRRARPRLARGRGQTDSRRCPGHARGPRTSGDFASLHTHDGDVGQPTGCSCRRRPVARTGARCGHLRTCPAISMCCVETTAIQWSRILLRYRWMGDLSSVKDP